MTERNQYAPCGPCRDEPDAASPCHCHHSPCLHDRNKTIAELRVALEDREALLQAQGRVISELNAIVAGKKYEYDVYALSNCERTPTKVGFARDVGDDEGSVQIRGSIFVHLDALPVSGKLSIRKHRETR